MTNLTPLEFQVTKMLLDGEGQTLAVLRNQLNQAIVFSRTMTGVGFYTEFSVPFKAPRIDGHPSFKLDHVNGTTSNAQYGLGFLLYVTDGAISMLEGYTYDEPWPLEVSGLMLTSSRGYSQNQKEFNERA